MKKQFTILVFIAFSSLSFAQSTKEEIHTLLDKWHNAAAEANFNDYFSLLANDAIYIGTDPTENWNIEAFKVFAKPYFDKGEAWSFKPLERNIFIKENLAWFDELLQTQMGLCRGSGVMQKIDGNWKLKHYVLSISVPNQNSSKVVEIKKDFDKKFIKSLKTRP